MIELLLTLLFNSIIAVFLLVIINKSLIISFIFSQTIGLSIFFISYAEHDFTQLLVEHPNLPLILLERLQQKLEPSVDFEALRMMMQQPAVSYLQWLKVAHQDEIYLLPVNEVDYFQAANKYTSVVTAEKEWLIKTPIKELETTLNPKDFWRIHCGTIVRLSAIARVMRDFQGRYLLQLHEHKEQLAVSRAYAYRFKQM